MGVRVEWNVLALRESRVIVEVPLVRENLNRLNASVEITVWQGIMGIARYEVLVAGRVRKLQENIRDGNRYR